MKEGKPSKAPSKRSAILTPFNHYREQLEKEGNATALGVAQKMWRDLPNEDKGKFIAEVANMETDREKKITKDELRILNQHLGIPERPLNAYTLFMQSFRDRDANGSGKDLIKRGAAAFRALGVDELQALKSKAERNVEKWKRKMTEYILTLPKNQQTLMLSKYNLYQYTEQERKKKLDDSMKLKTPKKETTSTAYDSDSSPKFGKIATAPTTSKKSRKLVESADSDEKANEENAAPSPKKKKLDSDDGSAAQNKTTKNKPDAAAESPRKIKTENGEKSPKKAAKLKEPEFPSQTTAHYFMTKSYEGKPKKIAKAYKQLDSQLKRKCRAQMRKGRVEYLKQIAEYIKTLNSAERKAFEQKMKASKAEQMKQIEWHIDEGTDTASKNGADSSDSSSDSDSS